MGIHKCCRPLGNPEGPGEVLGRHGRSKQTGMLSQEGTINESGQGVGRQRAAKENEEAKQLEARVGYAQETSGCQERGRCLGPKCMPSFCSAATLATFLHGVGGTATGVGAASCRRSGPTPSRRNCGLFRRRMRRRCRLACLQAATW